MNAGVFEGSRIGWGWLRWQPNSDYASRRVQAKPHSQPKVSFHTFWQNPGKGTGVADFLGRLATARAVPGAAVRSAALFASFSDLEVNAQVTLRG